MDLLSKKEEKFVLENLGILMEGFHLLAKNPRYVNIGGLEEDERIFAIDFIPKELPKWAKRGEITNENENLIANFATSFLEALSVFRRHKTAQAKRARKMEKILQKYIPYKLLVNC